MAGKEEHLAPLALRTQNKLVYGARNTSVCLVLSSRMIIIVIVNFI